MGKTYQQSTRTSPSDAIHIGSQINAKINLLDRYRAEIPGAYTEMAQTSAEYDRAIGTAIAKLSLGEGLIIDGKQIKEPAMAVIEKYAKAYCAQQKADMMIAESKYKSLMKQIDTIIAQLTGLQSIFRHLDVA